MARFDCLERPLKRLFFWYGRVLTRHPLPFIIIPFLLSGGLSFGFLYLERHMDVEYLFTSEHSNVRHSTEMMDAFFPNTRSENSLSLSVVGKNTKTSNSGEVIHDNDEVHSGDVWNSDSMEEIVTLNRKIQEFVLKDSSNGGDVSWKDVCDKPNGEENCPLHPVLQLFQYNASLFKHVSLTFPTHSIPLPPPLQPVRLFLPDILGGVATYSNNTIESVQAFRLIYFTKINHTESLAWEDEIRDHILSLDRDEFSHIYITVISTTTLDTEITALTEEGLPLMSVLFSVLFMFAVLVSLSADWIIAKPWLAFGGLISASLAIASAFGLLLFFLPFVDMVTSVPFLALGIGLDDMFVMMASWRKTAGNGAGVEERMCAAMSDAAVSITITTLTDLLAIGVGAISDIPSVRYFCIFAATSVMFDYVYQVTCFAGFMVLSGRRELANKHAITFQVIPPKSESHERSFCFRLWCTGGKSQLHPDAAEDDQQLCAMVFFRDTFGRILMTIPGKLFVCLLYAAYIGVSIWGCMNLRHGLELTRIVLDNSYANEFFHNWEMYYRQYNEPAFLAIYDQLDYCSVDDRKTISDAIGKFEDSRFFHSAEVSQVWTRDFDTFLHLRNATIDSKKTFKILLEMFFAEPRYQMHRDNIKWDDDEENIIASRFIIYPENLTTPEIKMEMEKEIWKIIKASDLNITISQQFLVFYESWNAVLPATLENFGIAAACVLLICTLLIPSPICSVYVALSIGSMAVGLVGFMTFWHVNLDSISMIQVIMSVGFSVDFTAHMTYAFCVEPGSSKNDRVREALYGLGVPIIQGALSTIVAILVLSTSNAYIFRVFFITLFYTMVFGAAHGLLFIPVVLSIIGPAPIRVDAKPEKASIDTCDSPRITDKPSPKKSIYDDVTPVFWPPMAGQNQNNSQQQNSPQKSVILNGNSSWSRVPSPEAEDNYIGEKLQQYDHKRSPVHDNKLSGYKRGSMSSVGDISNSPALQDEVQWSWQEQRNTEPKPDPDRETRL